MSTFLLPLQYILMRNYVSVHLFKGKIISYFHLKSEFSKYESPLRLNYPTEKAVKNDLHLKWWNKYMLSMDH